MYGLCQLPGGVLADRFGERPLLVSSSVLAAGTLTLVVVADSPAVLFLATALFGAGTALYGVSRFTILDKIYPEQLGTATGVTMAAGDLGNALMPPLAGAIAAAVAWQFGFGFAIPLFVLAAAGLWLTLPARSESETASGTTVSLEELLALGRLPVVVHGTVLLILWATIIQAFIGFYPTYLIDVKGLSTHLATALFGGFFALGALVKPIAGRTYDRVGVRVPLLAIMILTAIALATLPFALGLPAYLGLTVLVSSVLGYETVLLSNLTAQLPDDLQGTGLGGLRTVYIMIGAMSPVAFGAVADRGFFDEAFVGLACLAVLTVGLVVVYVEY